MRLSSWLVAAWALALLAQSSSARATVGDFVIAPDPVTSGTRIVISETVMACYHAHPQGLTTVATDGLALTVTVVADGISICFSAGDPAVEKPLITILQPMHAAAYSLHYIHRTTAGTVVLDRTVPLTVVQAACEYGVATGDATVGAAGDVAMFQVELTLGNLPDCYPSLTTDAAWLHLGGVSIIDQPPSAFIYHGYSVTLTADTNLGMERVAPLVLGEHAFELRQAEAEVLPDQRTRVREYYNAKWDHYFVTANRAEQDALGMPPFEDWQPTGLTFAAWAAVPGAPGTPVCRFFNATFAPKSTHFYGMEEGCAQVTQYFHGWQLETNDAFQVTAATNDNCTGMGDAYIPVYRLYNNGMGGAPNHRYLTDLSRKIQMQSQGWVAEGFGILGIAFCTPGFY